MADSVQDSSAQCEEVDRFAGAFGAVARGADALAMREQGYRILLSPARQTSPPRHFASWPDAAHAIEDLAHALPPLDLHTSRYTAGVLHALHTFARVRAGTPLSYLDQVRAYLDLTDVWVDERELDQLRAIILRLLGRLDLPVDLKRGMRAWSDRRRVPSREVAAHAESLVHEARKAAVRQGVPIPAHVEVDFVIRPTRYYAYAHYSGGFHGTIEFSSDIDWTAEAIKHSAGHEGFPGHQASAAAREEAIGTGEWGPLALPIMANSPTSPISEGLAENGLEILGWISTQDDELFAAHNRLTFGVLTNAAILRHEAGMPRDEVIELMIEGAGVDPRWAAYQYGFLTDPLWHTSFPHYWHGARLIALARAAFRDREATLFRALYRQPQTVATLRDLLRSAPASAASEPL